MKRVALLTDFLNFDPAYSLCRVVADQCKMLSRHGYRPRLLVRVGFQHVHDGAYEGAEIVELDHGDNVGDNQVHVTDTSTLDVFRLHKQLGGALEGCGIVLTHDLIFQPNMWIAHLAAKRLAAERTDLRWLHWVHSAARLNTASKGGPFRKELQARFPNSRLVAMHAEEINRKGALYGYERDQIVLIPNPVDFLADFHPAATQAVERLDLMRAGIVGIYPCRLDRGKQPHILVEIFTELRRMGYDARAVIADFHSTMGDKAAYREKLRAQAQKAGLPLLFTSDLAGEENGAPYSYCLPHKALMDLLEVADVLVHPSRSESDPLVLPEAAWKRCGLVLNFDLPVFRQYDGRATFGKFASAIDTATGMPGETTVTYASRQAYMHHIAAAVAYELENDPILYLHRQTRQERSLEGAWPKLEAAIECD